MELFAMPTVVTLSQCIGVFGCGWPISSNVSRKIMPSWHARKRAPSSASAADATTNLSILHSVKNAPFSLIGVPSIGKEPINKCPLARLRAFDSKRYEASLWMFNIMSEA